MRVWMSWAALALMACGGADGSEFVTDYATTYCDLVLACSDAASLTFDGIATHEDCLSVYGPDLQASYETCEYDAKGGKECLRALELVTCPAEGTMLDDAIPAACDEVWVNCTTVVEPTTTGTTGATTTATSETGE